MPTTTAARTSLGTAREITHTARRNGWDAHPICGDLRTRFVRGDVVVNVDWSRSGTVTYADRHVRVANHLDGHSLAGVAGYWRADRVRDAHTRNKREAVLAWLLADKAA
jgi:hypothetical protein